MCDKIIKPRYTKTFLKLLISEINIVKAYWNIAEEYNKKYIEKYGEDFLKETKPVLKLLNLRTGTIENVNLEDGKNSCYIKINYANSYYQAELIRVGIEDNKDYGYRIVSNKVRSPNIKVLINRYDLSKIKFRNLFNGIESVNTDFYNPDNYKKEDINLLYEELIKPSWNQYKLENGYKEN